jgi:ATP-binding cassette, subfamily B, bacterial MsbA
MLGATRLELVRIFVFTLLFAIFEGAGIGMLLPVLARMEGKESMPLSSIWESSSRWGRAMGIEEQYDIVLLLGVSFLALVVRSLFHYLREIDASRLKVRVGSAIRQRAAEAFFLADTVLLSAHHSGELYSAMTQEAERSAEALASRMTFATAMALFLVYVLLLFLLSPALTLYTLPVFLVVAYIFKRQSKTVLQLGKEVSTQNARFAMQVNDHLQGISRVKMRCQEQATIGELRTTIAVLGTSLLGIEKVRALVEIGIFSVLVLASFSIFLIALEELSMTFASLGLFIFILVRLVPLVTLMSSLWTHVHGCMASCIRLNQLIDNAAACREQFPGHRPFKRLNKTISFRNVSFQYPACNEEGFGLRDISMELPRGSFTALVGRSGAGKSTIIKLLTKFYTPQSGQILIDEGPQKEFNTAALRLKMAVVPQEPYLFDDTILANLFYGIHPHPGSARREEILTQGNCIKFVSRMERGLSTTVGERGVRLSAGQRQRLAIAPTLAIEPEILILDEPTSGLDSESEDAIQQTLNRWRGTLTMIVIAHRLSTVRHTDQIMVIDQGRLMAHGDHQDLLETCPLYKSLFEIQMEIH